MTMRPAPTPAERMRPINLGGSPQAGLFPQGIPLARPLVGSVPVSDARKTDPTLSPRARDASIAEILANPIQVESGTWGEAIAEMLAAGLYGRAAARERQAVLDDETRERKQEEGERSAYRDALNLSLDPSLQGDERVSQVASALLGASPEAAFEYRQSQLPDPEQQRMEEIISQLPPDQQTLARMNPQAFVAGMMRHRFPAPARTLPYAQAPDADEWEPF